MNKFILVFGLLTIGNFCFSQNNNIIIVDTSLRYTMHYGSYNTPQKLDSKYKQKTNKFAV